MWHGVLISVPRPDGPEALIGSGPFIFEVGISKKADHACRKGIDDSTLVLYVPYATPPWAIVVVGILLVASIGFLCSLYYLPSSRFPQQEAGYYETYDMEYDGHGSRAIPSGEWEWSPGNYGHRFYQVYIPSLILVWLSFQLGRGLVVGHSTDLCIFLALGSLGLICYCLGWVVQGDSMPFRC